MQLKINRLNLFIGLAAFLLVVNLLVIFDLNLFYIRAVLGFIFIIGVPGLLIMLSLKIREVGFWEYLVYTVGLSISFIMFAGLAVNWILPWLNITDRPLDTIPIVVCFDIFLLGLGLVAYKRNKGLKYETKFPKLDLINNIFFIVPMFFPVMAILGAFILNNGGPNYLTMVMLGAIAVYVFMVVLYRDKLNPNLYPWALWLIGLSLLLSWSMRSWYISGIDSNLEYNIFKFTVQKGLWSISNFNHAYNSMLSVGIFPSIISIFLEIGKQSLIKIYFPFIFSLLPIAVYIISKNFLSNPLSFLSAFLFISQEAFLRWSAIPLRQQIAFILFGISIVVLFNNKMSIMNKKIIFILSVISIIVSHYSTAYISLIVFSVILPIKSLRLFNRKDNFKVISLVIFITLILFTFLWYSQLTKTSDNLVIFSKNTFTNLNGIFKADLQAEARSPADQFNLFFKPKDRMIILNEYKSYLENSSLNKKEFSNSGKYPLTVTPPKISPRNVSDDIFNISSFITEIIKKSIKVLFLLGLISLFSIVRKEKYSEKTIIVLWSVLILVLISLLPLISINYDLIRLSQQILICSIFIPVLFIDSIKLFSDKYKKIAMGLIIISYFLVTSGFIYESIGGFDSGLRLNSQGLEYSLYYVNQGEILSGQWLFSNARNSEIFSDSYANTRLDLIKKEEQKNLIIKDVAPILITREGYVFASYQNKLNGIAFKPINGNLLYYNFPGKFLEDNKGKIYINGQSELFR